MDTGKGIEQDEMYRLFTLFGKLDRTKDQNQSGIGMGLTICNKIIQQCHGEIDARSDGAGKGSTFTFKMKMSLPSQEKKAMIEKAFFNQHEDAEQILMNESNSSSVQPMSSMILGSEDQLSEIQVDGERFFHIDGPENPMTNRLMSS